MENVFNSLCCNICQEVICDDGCENMYKRANNIGQLKEEINRLKQQNLDVSIERDNNALKWWDEKKLNIKLKEKYNDLDLPFSHRVYIPKLEKERGELKERLNKYEIEIEKIMGLISEQDKISFISKMIMIKNN